MPHSRYGYIDKADYQRLDNIEILAESDDAGVYLAASKNKQQVYLTGHPEYDASTLSEEYFRDLDAGGQVTIPDNYFTDNDPNSETANTWRSHGSLLFTNWLNYYVYQITPYQLDADHIKAIHPGKSRV